MNFHKKYGRHDLPWRKTDDPYRTLVSEVMLQQTQVERVIPYYESWLKKYPTVRSLANAPLADVLTNWQGLGYNRRAKMLWEAARTVVQEYKGKFPSSVEELEKLPGVGHYTARAVAAFAYNEDVVFIETNIRTAVTHEFFPDSESVSDAELLLILEASLPNGAAREWYAALMDYGSSLKRSGIRINSRSASYTKQSAFKGSGREVRGAILRELGTAPRTKRKLISLFTIERTPQVEAQLSALQKEGLIELFDRRYRLPR